MTERQAAVASFASAAIALGACYQLTESTSLLRMTALFMVIVLCAVLNVWLVKRVWAS